MNEIEYIANKMISKKRLPSATSLGLYAKKNITKLLSLHKKIEASNDKKIIATALLEQKKLIENLIRESTRSHALIGLTVLKAMIITGIKFDRFFDYTTPYSDNRGYDKIQELTYLENIIPLMQKYRTIEKANSVIPFILHLPNLNELPFSTELFDSLNDKNNGTPSFQNALFHQALQDYYEADVALKSPIKNALKMATYKGYSSAGFAYIDILEQDKKSHTDVILKILKNIRTNKFSSEQDREMAILKLKRFKNRHLNKKQIKNNRSISL